MKLSGDRNQCPGCSLYFNSTAAFDRHRHGSFKLASRRCLTSVEMLEKGMAINARGWWVGSLNPKFLAKQMGVKG